MVSGVCEAACSPPSGGPRPAGSPSSRGLCPRPPRGGGGPGQCNALEREGADFTPAPGSPHSRYLYVSNSLHSLLILLGHASRTRGVSRAPGAAHENTPFFKTHCPSPKHRLIRSLGPRGAIFNFLASAPRASAFDRRAGRAVPRRPGASGGLNQRLRAADRPRGPGKRCDGSASCLVRSRTSARRLGAGCRDAAASARPSGVPERRGWVARPRDDVWWDS